MPNSADKSQTVPAAATFGDLVFIICDGDIKWREHYIVINYAIFQKFCNKFMPHHNILLTLILITTRTIVAKPCNEEPTDCELGL